MNRVRPGSKKEVLFKIFQLNLINKLKQSRLNWQLRLFMKLLIKKTKLK